MLNIKKNLWKILLLVLIVNIINSAGHIINGTQFPTNIDPFSILTKTIGVEALLNIYLIVFYSSLSVTFLIFEKWMDGSKIFKGLKFGIIWGIIFFLGVIETYPAYGKTSILLDIRMGLVDSISVIVLGILLGKYFATDSQRSKTQITDNNVTLLNNSLILLAVTSFYIIGRYFAYSILKIESGFIERPIETFIWTLATGISFGLLYILTGRNISEKNLIKRSAIFGLINAGISWIIFNFYWPLVYEVSMVRFVQFIVGRAMFDTILVILGVYFSEWLINKKTAKDN